MADDHEARMQKARAQFSEWKDQGSPAPEKIQETDPFKFSSEKPPMRQIDNWKTGTNVQDARPLNEQIRESGQTLQQNGVTMQSEGLSQEKSPQKQSALDNQAQKSGNQPAQASRLETWREAKKDEHNNKATEPSKDNAMDKPDKDT